MQHALWRTCYRPLLSCGGRGKIEVISCLFFVFFCFTSAMSWSTCPAAGTWQMPTDRSVSLFDVSPLCFEFKMVKTG